MISLSDKRKVKEKIIWSVFVVLIIVIGYFFYAINPSGSKVTVKCSFHYVTGYYCTGCGGQRALHYLLHGEFLTALRYNIFIIFAPYLIYLFYIIIEVYILKKKKSLSSFAFSKQLGILVLIITILYTILRNIEYYPFIYLAPPK